MNRRRTEIAGTHDLTYIRVDEHGAAPVVGPLPREEEITISVNARDLVSLMCTPVLLEELALGFLFNEGFIAGMDEVADCRLCGSGRCVDVWLRHAINVPERATVTSGCSGGTTFETLLDRFDPLESDVRLAAARVGELMERLYAAATVFRESRGGHVSALVTPADEMIAAEDIGRHNTLDKIAGRCLREGVPTRDGILVTTGRVSSEMLRKAARMRVPIVISRTSPTSLSVEMARNWNITLIGYARGRGFRIYAGEERVVVSGLSR